MVGLAGVLACSEDEPLVPSAPKDAAMETTPPQPDATPDKAPPPVDMGGGGDTAGDAPKPDAGPDVVADTSPDTSGPDAGDTGSDSTSDTGSDGGNSTLSARIIAVGIPGAGAVSAVGTFHAGGPIHDKPEFVVYTAAGKILDPARVIVASSSNFGAPLANANDAPGSILSIDPTGSTLTVAADFATAGGQVSAQGGRLQLFTAQSPAFRNSVNNPNAVTATGTAVNLPLGISINNAFGRPWFADWTGATSNLGTLTIIDPTGIPLAGAPSMAAGGVFVGSMTNRNPQVIPGSLGTGTIGTAFLGKSPDGMGRAVFAAVNVDGSVIQAHAQKDVDGLAAAGTITAVVPSDGSAATATPGRAGMAFNWVPDKILYVSDPNANAIVALTLGNDGTVLNVASTRRITAAQLNVPVDIAPAVPEVANAEFSSNSTLAGGADLYVANRGNGTIVRLSQAGNVVAVRTVSINGTPLGAGRLNGIAISPDAQKIWLTVSGAVDGFAGAPGALIEVPAFSATTMARVIDLPGAKPEALGAALFGHDFAPADGLGPLYNGRSCAACHSHPTVGGQGPDGLGVVSMFGRLTNGTFDPLAEVGGPIARAHAIGELGASCGLAPVIPAQANVISLRNAPDLYTMGLLDAIPDAAILAQAAVARPDGIQGRANLLPSGSGMRVGRFGWKAQVGSLAEFVGIALRNELGFTNPLARHDVGYAAGTCGADPAVLEDDGQAGMALTAYIASLRPTPARSSDPHAAELFAMLGCGDCHLPAFPVGGGATLPIYTDLLIHDMGADLDDGVSDGSAKRRDWRTTPLAGLGARERLLHDGRATTVSAAIAAHGGEGRAAAQRFFALAADDRKVVLDFLATL
jgi:CxxC motif-containing protein (DUF1111 family)